MIKTYGMCLALLTCVAATPLAFAEDQETTVDRPGVGAMTIENGDKAPEMFKRKELAITDWKAKGLAQPKENHHWVQINDKYALIDQVNGTIVELVPVKK